MHWSPPDLEAPRHAAGDLNVRCEPHPQPGSRMGARPMSNASLGRSSASGPHHIPILRWNNRNDGALRLASVVTAHERRLEPGMIRDRLGTRSITWAWLSSGSWATWSSGAVLVAGASLGVGERAEFPGPVVADGVDRDDLAVPGELHGPGDHEHLTFCSPIVDAPDRLRRADHSGGQRPAVERLHGHSLHSTCSGLLAVSPT